MTNVAISGLKIINDDLTDLISALDRANGRKEEFEDVGEDVLKEVGIEYLDAIEAQAFLLCALAKSFKQAQK
jgi:hypothetical protein